MAQRRHITGVLNEKKKEKKRVCSAIEFFRLERAYLFFVFVLCIKRITFALWWHILISPIHCLAMASSIDVNRSVAVWSHAPSFLSAVMRENGKSFMPVVIRILPYACALFI